jgi:hypothetical protein
MLTERAAFALGLDGAEAVQIAANSDEGGAAVETASSAPAAEKALSHPAVHQDAVEHSHGHGHGTGDDQQGHSSSSPQATVQTEGVQEGGHGHGHGHSHGGVPCDGKHEGGAQTESSGSTSQLLLLSDSLADAGMDGSKAADFIADVSSTLGGFDLPATLIEECRTLEGVALFVELHCPAQGNCGVCPSKATCSLHGEDADGKPRPALDIEDMADSALGCSRVSSGKGKGAKSRSKKVAANDEDQWAFVKTSDENDGGNE